MKIWATLILILILIGSMCHLTGCSDKPYESNVNASKRIIMTSDTILSGMAISLLPQGRYSVEAMLPPGQCPGHYDVKISDIERLKKADLIISFSGMHFMYKTGISDKKHLFIDAGGRNWMSPDAYVYGLDVLAVRLSECFPEDKNVIERLKKEAVLKIKEGADVISQSIKKAGISGTPVIASSMQKEPLEWMGLRVVAEYGRQEAISAREVVDLVEKGKKESVKIVVDNLQSGPDAGRSIAETIRAKHVVLTNFPSENGYLATLGKNAEAIIDAAMKR